MSLSNSGKGGGGGGGSGRNEQKRAGKKQADESERPVSKALVYASARLQVSCPNHHV